MKKIDPYSIMITSKYSETIDDFINLELCSPRFNNNLKKFHFNPISLNKKIKQYFPSLETLHLYEREENEFLDDKKIFKRIYWYEINYDEYKNNKRNESKEYKNIIYNLNDREKYGNKIPKKVNKLDYQCFYQSSIESITIPQHINLINYYCFEECNNLTLIEMNKNYEIFEDKIIYENNLKLNSFKLPLNIKKINDKLINKNEIIKYEIPNEITEINSTFIDCQFLTIKIPKNIRKINEYSFYNCTNLKSIDISNSVTSIGNKCFYNCINLTSIQLSTSLINIGNECFYNCKNLKSIKIPSTIKSFNNYLFYDCQNLTEIIIPNSITSIGGYCFGNCKNLNCLILPNSLQSINFYSFQFCSSLTSIVIPSSVTHIGECCFSNCKSLKSALLPTYFKYSNENYFDYCTSLQSIEYLDIETNDSYYNSFCLIN